MGIIDVHSIPDLKILNVKSAPVLATDENGQVIEGVSPEYLTLIDGDGNPINIATREKQDETTVVGSTGKLDQVEMLCGEKHDFDPLATYDINLEKVLGTQRVVDGDGKLKVASATETPLLVQGILARANDEIIIPLGGRSTVAVQLAGTFSQTVAFYGSIDGQTWYAWSCRTNLAVVSQSVINSTTGGIYIASVNGLNYFKAQCTAYTSGACRVLLSATHAPASHQSTIVAYAYGTQNSALMQRPTSFELMVHDAVTRDALFAEELWNPNIIYYPGDMVTYNGKRWRCIAQTANGVSTTYMPGTTYWQLEIRPSRALSTKDYVSAPDAPRLRIEHDLDAYQYRIQENLLVEGMAKRQNDTISMDYSLTIQQLQGGMNGKQFALGQSGMSKYTYEEVR